MAVVGYDDARQALLLRNSWGATWGADGMAWLPYAAWAVAGCEAYRVVDDIDP
jgi:C1A family cysteine protease